MVRTAVHEDTVLACGARLVVRTAVREDTVIDCGTPRVVRTTVHEDTALACGARLVAPQSRAVSSSPAARTTRRAPHSGTVSSCTAVRTTRRAPQPRPAPRMVTLCTALRSKEASRAQLLSRCSILPMQPMDGSAFVARCLSDIVQANGRHEALRGPVRLRTAWQPFGAIWLTFPQLCGSSAVGTKRLSRPPSLRRT